jgi:hypothetical protein
MHKLLVILGIFAVVALGATLFYSINTKSAKIPVISSPSSATEQESAFGKLNKKVEPTPNSTGKKLTIKNLTLEYPSDWPTVSQDAIIKSSLGVLSAEIPNNDRTLRIVVLTSLNSIHDINELNSFNKDLISGGYTAIVVDGNNGVRSPITPSPIKVNDKVITAFINSPDGRSQFSVSLESTGTLSDTEMDKLFDSLISKARFTLN